MNTQLFDEYSNVLFKGMYNVWQQYVEYIKITLNA